MLTDLSAIFFTPTNGNGTQYKLDPNGNPDKMRLEIEKNFNKLLNEFQQKNNDEKNNDAVSYSFYNEDSSEKSSFSDYNPNYMNVLVQLIDRTATYLFNGEKLTGKIESIVYEDGIYYLIINGEKFSLNSIIDIKSSNT